MAVRHWFLRLDRSTRQRFSFDECVLSIHVGVRESIRWYYFIVTEPGREGRWVRRKPFERPTKFFVEVSPSDVIQDLRENGVPIPAELQGKESIKSLKQCVTQGKAMGLSLQEIAEESGFELELVKRENNRQNQENSRLRRGRDGSKRNQ
jgi:hypothetical protein